MKYVPLPRVARAEVERIVASGTDTEIGEALIGAAMTSTERGWVEECAIRQLHDGAPEARRCAALALGHLARIHGAIAPEAVELLGALLDDPVTAGAAEDALDDVAMFVTAGDVVPGSA
ncbi:hypothetical protein [Streptomyces sp. UNOC14_S4]|uniref:hypothetical protein n=1 Tax=Streptomyces sp. UNOC14_S4 TaxID=2872340 RepID=UPI001E3EAF81|nr:hypothetical protein [Streptomyces sp. UNOC14_S4]MCC3769521.1 hypothetical protein [Streptomyces sp. UNOC14_S4]